MGFRGKKDVVSFVKDAENVRQGISKRQTCPSHTLDDDNPKEETFNTNRENFHFAKIFWLFSVLAMVSAKISTF